MQKEPDEITKQIAQNLVLLRKMHRLTQPGLGKLIKVGGDTVRGWEACRRKADPENIIAIAKALKLEGGWLWFYQDHSAEAVQSAPSKFNDEDAVVWARIGLKRALGAELNEEENLLLARVEKAAGDGGLSECPPAQLIEDEEKTVISAALGVRAAFLQDHRKAG